MALIKCHECRRDISSEAERCPNCGASDINSLNSAPPFNLKRDWKKLTVFILAISALLIWPIFFSSTTREQKSSVLESPDTSTVIAVAQIKVRNVLKSPDTAKFPSGPEEHLIDQLETNKWKVSSYVDSQNSFGAMLRSHYTAIIQYVGNDRWRLIDLKIYE